MSDQTSKIENTRELRFGRRYLENRPNQIKIVMSDLQ